MFAYGEDDYVFKTRTAQKALQSPNLIRKLRGFRRFTGILFVNRVIAQRRIRVAKALVKVRIMVESNPTAEVVQFTPDEYRAFQESEVQRGMGMTKSEFIERYLANEFTDANPTVTELVAFLRIGQNGVGPT